jgi:hypothetical protein
MAALFILMRDGVNFPLAKSELWGTFGWVVVESFC